MLTQGTDYSYTKLCVSFIYTAYFITCKLNVLSKSDKNLNYSVFSQQNQEKTNNTLSRANDFPHWSNQKSIKIFTWFHFVILQHITTQKKNNHKSKKICANAEAGIDKDVIRDVAGSRACRGMRLQRWKKRKAK